MGLDLRLQPKVSQQLVMTPQLQQAIRLLQLSHTEMADALRQEIAQNPVLDDTGHTEEGPRTPFSTGDPAAPLPAAPGSALSPAEAGQGAASAAELVSSWSQLTGGAAHPRPSPRGGEPSSLEATHARPESLTHHLHWQVQMAALGERVRAIAHYLVEEIDEDGYLPPDAVVAAGTALDVSQEQVAAALSAVQECDPPGVGAADLRECLLTQARLCPSMPVTAIAILEDHLPALTRRAHREIARALRVSVGEVHEAVRAIAQLQPYPGRAFATDAPDYIVPDIYVMAPQTAGGEFVIALNEDDLPPLKISPLYEGQSLSTFVGETKSYVQDKLRAAHWLMRSVAMRQRTIARVMRSILTFQREFFLQGKEHLRPLVLRDVAVDVGLHESTISRVTSNKYVHTPHGIFELKYFFNSTIRGGEGRNVASASVRSHIERLIAQENKHAPLSDQKIVDLLLSQDITIARRTVAKYRKMLRKEPSCARRRDG